MRNPQCAPGPKITLKMSCFDCPCCRTERYAVQGDSGHDVYCDHPQANGRRIGDTRWDTPEWCPVYPAEALAAVQTAIPAKGDTKP